MKDKQLTTWEASCVITGYGIGAGVLSMPYVAAKVGFAMSVAILVIVLAASYVLHMMIADIAIKSDSGGQIISCLSRFLFRGKWKHVLSVSFFVLMGVILCANLATYIAAAEEIIVQLIPVPSLVAKLLFYAVAASVVLLGLKVVGISEKYAVGAIIALIAVLAAASVFAEYHPIPMGVGTLNQILAYYGLAMFALSAFFAVPQAVEGLNKDVKKVRRAVFGGLLTNFCMILVITFCALAASKEVTEVAMVGWSAGIGMWAEVIGSVFTLLAMLTTYWSLSLALSGIVEEMLKLDRRICWLLATVPSLLLVLTNLGGFMEFLRLAGGLIAIVIALMVVPCYRNARREIPGGALTYGGTAVQAVIILAYILMAVGSVVPY